MDGWMNGINSTYIPGPVSKHSLSGHHYTPTPPRPILCRPATMATPSKPAGPSSSSNATSIALSPAATAAIAASAVAFAAVAILWNASRNNTLLRRYATAKDLPDARVNKKGSGKPLRLTGYAVSVGDSDGFRFFHTPSLRWYSKAALPRTRNTDETIAVRMAGTDCPEAAHFGMPAQPFSYEAYQYTLSALMPGATVKPGSTKFLPESAERLIPASKGGPQTTIRPRGAMVYYQPYPRALPFYWRNLSIDLLSKGLGVVYTQAGAEYGGLRSKFDKAEETARRKKRGIWSLADFVPPSAHKRQGNHNQNQNQNRDIVIDE
ncbi:hypothetical protein BCR44DRAFT_1440521 [Catenaria anguillulae PL171]|uniref:TNase-like domain-containing protein n=1 Tax=Catenaria anguillulae PL171 TaxID=765915 RepID=A0A1Y2HCI7_9FUNG|nr:hypothetical protein BCR44DRAFT_1440521 [Catenaria anguillulae PL171]